MPHVRCSKCGARATLPRHPEAYTRIPKCRGCQRKMTLDGKPPYGSRESPRRYARYRIDRWRLKHERGRAAKRCQCCGYSFIHRWGSGYCVHNPKVTDEMLQLREQRGTYS